LIEEAHPKISISQQCTLLGLPRSSYYYSPAAIDEISLSLMRQIDEEFTRHPFIGTRRMNAYLNDMNPDLKINRKRIQHLYRLMDIQAIYQKPNTSKQNKEHKIYPYLLRDVPIEYSNQVWSADITYIPMKQGFLYLVAIIDWYSRYVLTWELSNSLETDFCINALENAFAIGHQCKIFNTDQGCQFTSNAFVGLLIERNVGVSMDGRGRALDNIFIERLWRSVKYECIYLHELTSVRQVYSVLAEYFHYYNNHRFHQSLNYKTPISIYKN
jgi:putative transposase